MRTLFRIGIYTLMVGLAGLVLLIVASVVKILVTFEWL